ncbi:MAG: MmgE/PrpD family protein, partial [Desulfobulbia bacterium]
ATCGVFGAAAAAAKLLGMDADGIRNAFGIALSQAAGSLEFLADGAWTKRSHVGQAAQNGLMCAVLANEGYRGVKKPFEGKAGFFAAYAPDSRPEKAVKGLREEWETLRLAVKPYPSCRYSHASIDALLELVQESDIDPQDIEDVQIGVSQTGILLIGEPEARKQNPKNVVDGQFSMPFCAAVALRERGFKWDDYDRHLNDKETLELCRKVRTVVDQRAENEFPENLSGVALVRTKHGNYEKFVAVPKGEPDNFLSDQEFQTKFDGLCEPYLGEENTRRLADLILALENSNNVQSIIAMSQKLESKV